MSTTGLKSSGSDFTGINDILKNVYEPTLQNLIVADSELHDVFTQELDFETKDGPDGKQITIPYLFNAGGGFVAMDEDGYLPDASLPSTKQGSTTLKQLASIVELSGRTLRRAKNGEAAVITWADQVLPFAAQRHVHNKDRMLVGPGTGIVAMVNDASPSNSDLDIDNAFGIAGLPGAMKLFMEGDSLRASPNADGSSPRTGAMIVASILYASEKITTDALATSLADNDYLFVGGANGFGNGTLEVMGLEGHLDDGTNVSTYQGLSRSTYPRLKSQILDSTSSSFTGTLSEELIDYANILAWTRGSGQPTDLVVSYEGRSAFWKSMKADRQIVNPSQSGYQGGWKDGDVGMSVGSKVVRIRACRKVPYSRAYFIDSRSMKIYRNGQGQWDDTTGSIWNRVTNSTGRRDAFYATFIEELQTGGLNPQASVKITNLAQGI